MSGRLLSARACAYPVGGTARGRECRHRRQRHVQSVRPCGFPGVNGNDGAGVLIHSLHRTLERAGQDAAGCTA